MESKIMKLNRNNSKAFQCEMSQYIPIDGRDTIELTPRIVFETLKYEVDNNKDDFKRLLLDENSCDSCDETLSSVDDIEKPIFLMSDLELSEKIADIYLSKMRQVAETSGKLLVSAARVRDIFTF